MFDWTI